MPTSRRTPRRIALATLAILVLIAVAVDRRAASRFSPEAIRAELRAVAPPGSTVEQAKAAIRSRLGRAAEGMSWNVDREGRITELIARRGSSFRPGRLPWGTGVYGHWHFDGEGRLQDVSVRYYVETPFAFDEVEGP